MKTTLDNHTAVHLILTILPGKLSLGSWQERQRPSWSHKNPMVRCNTKHDAPHSNGKSPAIKSTREIQTFLYSQSLNSRRFYAAMARIRNLVFNAKKNVILFFFVTFSRSYHTTISRNNTNKTRVARNMYFVGRVH